METYKLANELLTEDSKLNEMAVGELISSGVLTTVLGPLAAAVLGVFYGSTQDIIKKLKDYKNKDSKSAKPLERVKIKLSQHIEEDSDFFKSALTKLAKSKELKVLNDVTLSISKQLKLSKEEFVALHDYLFEQRNKLQNMKQLVND